MCTHYSPSYAHDCANACVDYSQNYAGIIGTSLAHMYARTHAHMYMCVRAHTHTLGVYEQQQLQVGCATLQPTTRQRGSDMV